MQGKKVDIVFLWLFFSDGKKKKLDSFFFCYTLCEMAARAK